MQIFIVLYFFRKKFSVHFAVTPMWGGVGLSYEIKKWNLRDLKDYKN